MSLANAGYDTYYLQDPSLLENKIKESPPHLLVFSIKSLVQDSLSQFIGGLLEISPEICFIALVDSVDEFQSMTAYNEYGLMDIILNQGEGIPERTLWSVDRACENLYKSFQNDDLLDQLRKQEANQKPLTTSELSDVTSSSRVTLAPDSGVIIPPITSIVEDYRRQETPEDLIQKFLMEGVSIRCAYFKYLPSVKSLMAMQARDFNMVFLRGVGCQLSIQEASELNHLHRGMIPKSLLEVLKDGMRFTKPRVMPLYLNSSLEGVFAYSEIEDSRGLEEFKESFALFSLIYSTLLLEKEVKALQIYDSVTELFNRRNYLKRLKEEVARVTRSNKAISVIKMSVDQLVEIEKAMGSAARDHILKTVADLVQKSSRVHDFCARSREYEIAMVLPDCTRKGAMIRSERVRRAIENSNWLENGMKVTVSFGISEYPTLAAGPRELDDSATKALSHIADKGGNKLCLFKAPPSYRPHYVVNEESA